MTKILHSLIFLAIIVVSAALGFVSYNALNSTDRATTVSAKTSDIATDFRLADTQGEMHSLKSWDKQWRLVNFWATWCPPCIEEMPLLNSLQQRRPELRIIGIASDDAESVKRFKSRQNISFPLLIAETSGSRLAREWGNDTGALPFTALVNPNGKIVRRWLGMLLAADIDAQLAEHLP